MIYSDIQHNYCIIGLDSIELLFSYKTLVGVKTLTNTYTLTRKDPKRSVTTSRHINKWTKLSRHTPIEVEYAELEKMILR